MSSYELLPKIDRNDDLLDQTAAETPQSPSEFSLKQRFSGWRGGILAASVLTAFVLLLNIILSIVAATRWIKTDGIATAFTGDCDLAGRWSTALHLIINLLSSGLLGASNYCMQRLVAPTREEIDKTHAQKRWLDVGIPSLRNLASINGRRVLIWTLLALSSIPLHLLYNSVVFETVGANDAYYFEITEDFFKVKDSWYHISHEMINDPTPFYQAALLDGKYLDRNLVENITADECKSRYSQQFISAGTGFCVTSPDPDFPDTSLVKYFEHGSSNILGSSTGPPCFYCLSLKSPPQRCSIEFSQAVLAVVVVCNAIKLGAMIYILSRLDQKTIVTIGDAIQSFLETPDPTTDNCCLMSRGDVRRVLGKQEARHGQRFEQTRRHRWISGCSRRRWILSLFLYISVIAVVAGLVGFMHHRWDTDYSNSFGRVNPDSLIDIDLPYAESIIPYILLANTPQAIITLIFLTYNGQFTAMLTQLEFSNYAIKRAPLRVTLPSPSQRSTYFLSLPFTFSIPLLLSSIILHWLTSQSIFLARIAVFTEPIAGRAPSEVREPSTAVGYSNTAIICTLALGCGFLIVLGIVSYAGSYPVGLPIGGTNSAVISAACHVKHEEQGDDDIVNRPLQWGVTIPADENVVGHCSFSSMEVGRVQLGFMYAGDVAA
ncbi:unnamed protein product [Periconia digitata]|uniref:DUF6536 domain-containing protein n=1 Tax=Periconia digitata TaxID=1303443 RepID=A0A9W4UII9_9PLEO|nr:unnamed protein product [Periconia digitata]